MSLAQHPEFIAGNVNTDFIPLHREKLFEFAKQREIDAEVVCCSLSAILTNENETHQSSKSNLNFN